MDSKVLLSIGFSCSTEGSKAVLRFFPWLQVLGFLT